MKTIGLIVNRQKDNDLAFFNLTRALLQQNGYEVLLHQEISGADLPVIADEMFYKMCDAFVTLGGDGTILEIAPSAARYGKPILGVNLGHLGYLTQLERDDLEKLPEILLTDTKLEQRFMLKTELHFSDGMVQSHYVLNDVTLSRRIVSNMLHTDLFANDEFVYNFRGDGLIFATPTGSTAYSMSSGGPIADCGLMDIILLTPVCEHSMFSKSLVFSAEDELCCRICRDAEDAFIIADGKVLCSAENIEKIIIKKSEYTLSLFQPDGNRFYRVLNSKFSDGGAYEKFTAKGDY